MLDATMKLLRHDADAATHTGYRSRDVHPSMFTMRSPYFRLRPSQPSPPRGDIVARARTREGRWSM
ncbi:hypothetical protein AB2C40_33170, partial [Pseudomonas aeruginosa]